jgi:hypothetical protein
MNSKKPAAILSGFGVLGLSLLLSGCGGKLDMGAINKSISDGLTSSLGLVNPAVTCPAETRPFKAGDTFDCDVTPTEGGHMVITVTQTDDKGAVDWKVAKTEGLLNLKPGEEEIAKGIKAQTGADATVACGEGKKFLAVKEGDTIDCTATMADGTAHAIKLTIKDAQGNFSWALVQPEGAAAPEDGAATDEAAESTQPPAE